MRLPAEAWKDVEWREGSNQPLSSRFAAARVRPASRDHKLVVPHPVEWLVVEWPEGEAEPTKYWLSTLPEDRPLAVLVDVIKLRWRIERDYEELKSELGLAHFEGRGWRGFHHHASLCIAAYGFLILERSAFPPSARRRREKSVLSGRSRSLRAPNPSRTWLSWVPQSGDVGMGVSIFSYAGHVQFGLITDAGLTPDPEALVSRFPEEFENYLYYVMLDLQSAAEQNKTAPSPRPARGRGSGQGARRSARFCQTGRELVRGWRHILMRLRGFVGSWT